ncbi:Condensin complex subunit 3 [Ceratocystis lukuohia]|uniref:Condensin complex subunit 3 n=1 Tax=Ceratocystis lukuohia TaxID=2019550 RepID=A0ABR4MG16_9PEZI
MPPAKGTSRAKTTSSRSSHTQIHVDIPEDTPENDLRPQICAIFRDAQRTTASHRKFVISLRKIHEACCYEPIEIKKGSVHEFDEETFNTEFIRCVLRVLPVRKSESVGEKSIRFIGLFLRHASEKDNEIALDEVEEDASVMPETPATRLTTKLLESIMPHTVAKDKYVRFRSTQLVSQVVNSLDAIDDELFQKLRYVLLKRIRDKESMVRSQAVLGLTRLAGNGEAAGNSDDDEEQDLSAGLLGKLLDLLQNDPSPEVRRALLVNLPILPTTLPYLLERARDQDALTRRAVYSRLLPALGDFRHLSLSMREKLLRWGLRDRDENVRKAAGKLFRERWIEDCASAHQEQPEDPEAPPPTLVPSIEGLQELLERIDIINSGEENGVAMEAMKGFWEGRPDYREAMVFDDTFWETLSAESVFMARTFNDFCRSNPKYEYLVEEKMPEVTRLAFFLERYVNALLEAIKRVGENSNEDEEEDTIEQEFIVEQLLRIALTLDYSDEVGRRKMFALLRQVLSNPAVPDDITKLIVEVLRDICAPDAAGEREFCSVVLEAVADVHDTIAEDDEPQQEDADESFHSAHSAVSSRSHTATSKDGSHGNNDDSITEEEAEAKAIKEIVINMKCLHIVQCMLTNVRGSLQKNDHLVAMLNNLVVPAVRSHEAPVRERGLVCLGLCALLDKALAEENLTLFVHFFSKGHAALQITALQILTDILNVHGAQLLTSNPTLLKVYVRALRLGSRAPDVQATAVLAVSKLLLGQVVTDPDVASELLKTLVIAYFDPSSADNQSVRQALNYFLPVFCFSRPENQELLRTIALDALHSLYNIRDAYEDDGDADVGDEMVSINTIGSCFVDWTDPRKCFNPQNQGEGEKKHVPGNVHLELAFDILERLNSNMSKDERKTLAPLLGKLYISPLADEDKLRELFEEVSEAVESNLLSDASSKNSLYKLHVTLGKIVNSLKPKQNQSMLSGAEKSSIHDTSGMTSTMSTSVKAEEYDEEEASDNTVTAKDDQDGTTMMSEASSIE